MQLGLRKNSIWVLLAACLAGGMSGCSSQVTHHSGQIGRYFGNGVSFSVPVVQEATDPLHEDKFWEVRQGIGGADVVVLGPFVTQDAAESFRENMVLSSRPVSGIDEVAQFRQQQIEVLRQQFPGAVNFADGQDETGCWETFEYTEHSRTLACKAWFFLDTERSLGYCLTGTAQKTAKFTDYCHDFDRIAVTFKIGAPYSSFSGMSEALAKADQLLSQDTIESNLTHQVHNNSQKDSEAAHTDESAHTQTAAP
ncbi:MAG: hypothetical protein Q4F00_05605 [bacterium]|nr:hypothetical protein [bacterium]